MRCEIQLVIMASPTVQTEDEGEEANETTDPDVEDTVEGVEDAVEGEENEDEESSTDGDEDEEDVAEVQMPGDEEDVDDDGDDSGGILSSINTKAVIVISAAVGLGALILMWVRSGSGNQRSPATEQQMDQPEEAEEEINISAPDSEPLEQDGEFMQQLGMGSN